MTLGTPTPRRCNEGKIGSVSAPTTEQNGLIPEPATYYSALVADLADATMVTTLDGAYRYVSPACERRFGWRPEEMEGAHEDAFVHPDDLPPLQVLRSEGAPGEVTTATFRFRCRDGSYVWTEATSVLVDGEDGNVVVSTLRDIDARHQSVAHLRRQALMDPSQGWPTVRCSWTASATVCVGWNAIRASGRVVPRYRSIQSSQ